MPQKWGQKWIPHPAAAQSVTHRSSAQHNMKRMQMGNCPVLHSLVSSFAKRLGGKISDCTQRPANIPLNERSGQVAFVHPPPPAPKQNHADPSFAPNPNPPPHSQHILLGCAQAQTCLLQTLGQNICFLEGCATAALQKRLCVTTSVLFPKIPFFLPNCLPRGTAVVLGVTNPGVAPCGPPLPPGRGSIYSPTLILAAPIN